MDAITFHAFQGELEKISAAQVEHLLGFTKTAEFEKLSELEKEAIRRAIMRRLGRGAKWVGGKVDAAAAKHHVSKGNTDMAIWHSEKKPISRIARVMGADPMVGLPVAAIEGVSQTLLAPIPMAHQPSLAWMKYSRKIRGKMTPGEMFEKLKKHRTHGAAAT